MLSGKIQQGLVTVPFWKYWTSPYSSHYRPYTYWLGDVQWGHLMTHVQSSTIAGFQDCTAAGVEIPMFYNVLQGGPPAISEGQREYGGR